MDIKLAATFLKVAEIGNITKAAEQLGYSQASVTSHIQQLEQHLGVQLFDRIGRGIQLTDAGSNFRPYASSTSSIPKCRSSSGQTTTPIRP